MTLSDGNTAELMRPPTLREAVAEHVASGIVSGVFPAGTFLPPEPELCRRFGVSRTVIREALGTLEARGLVDVQHGRGAYVQTNRSPAVSALLRFEWQAGRGTAAHLLETRRILEANVARLAASRATAENLRSMEHALEGMADAATPEEYIAADLAFHEAIVRAAGNPILTLLNDAMADLLQNSRRQTYFLPGAVETSLRDHRRVYERIAAADVDGAEREMAAVLDQVERDITAAGLAPDLQKPTRTIGDAGGSDAAAERRARQRARRTSRASGINSSTKEKLDVER